MFHGTFQWYVFLVLCCQLNNEILSGGDLENLWPLDCQGLHSSHGRGNQGLSPMQIALPTHDILQHCYLLRIQVLILIICQTNIFQTVWLKKSQPESFLQLVSTIPGKVAAGHQLDLRKHQDQHTRKLPGPLRLKYPKISWKKQELLVSLTQDLILVPKCFFSSRMIEYRVRLTTTHMRRT